MIMKPVVVGIAENLSLEMVKRRLEDYPTHPVIRPGPTFPYKVAQIRFVNDTEESQAIFIKTTAKIRKEFIACRDKYLPCYASMKILSPQDEVTYSFFYNCHFLLKVKCGEGKNIVVPSANKVEKYILSFLLAEPQQHCCGIQ